MRHASRTICALILLHGTAALAQAPAGEPADKSAPDATPPDASAADESAADASGASSPSAADASAPASPDDAPADDALPSARCAALFGDPTQREENASRREASLISVARVEGVVEIVHGVAGWTAPQVRALPGLTVLGVEPSGEQPTARVRVDERWSAFCAPGVYRVASDDALGAGSEVLAVLEEGLLASHSGALVLVPLKRTLEKGTLEKGALEKPASFRMIWRSGFALSTATGGGGGGGSGGSTMAARTSALGNVRKASSRKSPMRTLSPRTLRK